MAQQTSFIPDGLDTLRICGGASRMQKPGRHCVVPPRCDGSGPLTMRSVTGPAHLYTVWGNVLGRPCEASCRPRPARQVHAIGNVFKMITRPKHSTCRKMPIRVGTMYSHRQAADQRDPERGAVRDYLAHHSPSPSARLPVRSCCSASTSAHDGWLRSNHQRQLPARCWLVVHVLAGVFGREQDAFPQNEFL